MEELVKAEVRAGLFLRGRIGRVDREPDGSLYLIDYKTGNAAARLSSLANRKKF